MGIVLSMSGHSKWSTIKRQKGAADAKRGQAFTKFAAAITLAVRSGGGVTDPESNFKLRLAIDRARAANMPKENIERAVERGRGGGDKGNFDEVSYEGFGPGGITFVAIAATDNKNRTTSEVKNIIERNGGIMGTPGSVSYQFQQKGSITVEKNGKSFDDLLLLAADAGAADAADAHTEAIVYTKPEDVKMVKDALEKAGVVICDTELILQAVTPIQVTDIGQAKKILDFIDSLERHDDVQKVYTNFDISEEILEKTVY